MLMGHPVRKNSAPARRVPHPGLPWNPSHYLAALSSQPPISRANQLAAGPKGRCPLFQVSFYLSERGRSPNSLHGTSPVPWSKSASEVTCNFTFLLPHSVQGLS